jgi:hypothetical protein
MIRFKLEDKEYPITINYLMALQDLPEKFGIDLTKIFTDPEKAEDTMNALILDDEKGLRLAWYFVEKSAVGMEWEDFLQKMNGKVLETFREDFWSAVVNFSGPLKKNLLTELWTGFKREIKKAKFDELMSQPQTSDASFSDYNHEE